MQAKKHPEYNFEKVRLEETQKAIDAFTDDTSNRESNAGADEWSHAALDGHNYEIINRYLQARDNPYFGRIDFQPDTADEAEMFYIGYESLNLGRHEVFDWRAPIGSLLAGGKAEHQSYKAPEGIIKGRLLLRRRYTIVDEDLQQITDEFDRRTHILTEHKVTEFTSGEEYLLQELYSRGDAKLQDIVKTIQKQQDDIIRAKHDHIVLINGVAGSGKTSVAIHRMAYLLYPASKTNIRADRSIIFCPNPIFLHYIEDLLPRLGERNVRQTTFAEWALTRMQITDRYKVVDSSQPVFLDSHADRNLLKKLWQRARLKGNLRIKELLDRYVAYLMQNQTIPEKGLTYRQIGDIRLDFFFSVDEISNAIEDAQNGQSVSLTSVRESALSSLRKMIDKKYDLDVDLKAEEQNKQADSLEEAAKSVENPEEQKILVEEAKTLRAFRGKAYIPSINKRIVSLVSVLLQKDFDQIWKPIKLIDTYYALYQDVGLLSKLAQDIYSDEEIQMLINKDVKPDTVEMEDLAGLLYFHEHVESKFNGKYDHIIIDEVQDFSPLQLELIFATSNENSMTLVGDVSQGIHAHRGITAWGELTDVFPQNKFTLENITQSYRSTQELVHFSNEVLKQIRKDHTLLAEPFARKGKTPIIVHVKSTEKQKEELLSRIKLLQKGGFKNIAVIVKTMEQAIALIGFLDVAGTPPVISIKQLDTDFKYVGGLAVMPVILTKGMEFEAVIVHNANETEYSSQKLYDGRLLYVAVTRALHEMQIMYTGELSGFLETAKNKATLEEIV